MTDRAVDVIVGGPGREAAVSRASGASIAAAARAAAWSVAVVDCGDRLDPAVLRSGALVFNIVHGTYGEDGTLQAELEALGRAFVGSGVAASRLCMDKQATRDRLAAVGLPIAWGRAFASDDLPDDLPVDTALVLKPCCDGSSVGVHLLADRSELAAAVAAIRADLGAVPLLVERRLCGDEFTVGLIDDGQGSWQALPPIRVAAADGFYDYAAKYSRDDTTYDFAIEAALAARLQDLSRSAAVACGCRDLVRVDLMADGDALFILEINTLPGFTDHSLVPKAAARIGVAMPELVDRLLACARRRAAEGRI